MVKRIAKVSQNSTKVNFQASPEIGYWAKKYNTSLEEIQVIFQENGYSMAKTLAALQSRPKAA